MPNCRVLVLWRVYLAPVMRWESARPSSSLAPRALALWYVTSLRSGRDPVLESSRLPLLSLPWTAARENDMITYTSPPLLDARREPFCRGLAAEFMNGLQEVTLSWGMVLNNVSTAELSNVSEGSFVRSHDARNCLTVLHHFFFLQHMERFSACHVIVLSVHARVEARVSADRDKAARASCR